MKIVIGSRGSALALWQANWIGKQLADADYTVEIKTIRTSGDRLAHVPLADSGVKGLFIKEIEEALAAGGIDVAVHSLKDLPADLPPGLTIAAIPSREDARDALVSRDGTSFATLPPGARLGTSSVRRQSQLLHLRPDLRMVQMRGNVDTRLRKLERGECEALVMAAAGLVRLGLESSIRERFPVQQLCPAVGQGALAVEIRDGDGPAAQAVSRLDDADSHGAVRAERALLRSLGGGCSVPIAGYATLANGALSLVGVVARPDGARLIRASASGADTDPEGLGQKLANELLRQGAGELLEAS